MKIIILPNCLKGKYGYHSGEFSNTSFVMFDGVELRVKTPDTDLIIYSVISHDQSVLDFPGSQGLDFIIYYSKL